MLKSNRSFTNINVNQIKFRAWRVECTLRAEQTAQMLYERFTAVIRLVHNGEVIGTWRAETKR